MATSSIHHVFIVKDPKKVEAFADSLERASKAPRYKITTKCRQVESTDELSRLLKARRQRRR